MMAAGARARGQEAIDEFLASTRVDRFETALERALGAASDDEALFKAVAEKWLGESNNKSAALWSSAQRAGRSGSGKLCRFILEHGGPADELMESAGTGGNEAGIEAGLAFGVGEGTILGASLSAARAGHWDLAKRLGRLGTDPASRPDTVLEALAMCDAESGAEGALGYLEAFAVPIRGFGERACMMAAAFDRKAFFKALAQGGAKIDKALNLEAFKSLVRRDRAETVEWLLEGNYPRPGDEELRALAQEQRGKQSSAALEAWLERKAVAEAVEALPAKPKAAPSL